MKKFIVYTLLISMTILLSGDLVYAYSNIEYSAINAGPTKPQSRPHGLQSPRSIDNHTVVTDMNQDVHEMDFFSACAAAYLAIWAIFGTAIGLNIAATNARACSCGCGSAN